MLQLPPALCFLISQWIKIQTACLSFWSKTSISGWNFLPRIQSILEITCFLLLGPISLGHSSQHISAPVHISSEQKAVEMCFYKSLCISKGYKAGQVFSRPNVINPRQVNKFLQSVLHSGHDFQFQSASILFFC